MEQTKRYFTPSGDLFTQIFYLIREWQISNRFITIDAGTDLTVWESTFLLEIDSDENCSAKDLSDMFGLDKSTVSRRLGGLEEKAYLKTVASKEDSRARRLLVSAKGKAYLRRYARIVGDIMKGQYSDFSKAEKEAFLDYSRHFNDRCGTSVRKLRSSDDDPIRIEMRRFVRSLGVMRPDYMGSDLNNSQWHVLCDIFSGQAGESVQSIARSFHAPASSLSSMLRVLEKKNYLSRIPSNKDNRKLSLAVTPEGEKRLKEIESAGSQLVRVALEGLSEKELKDCARLLIKVSGVETSPFESSYSIVHLHSEEQLREARTFLIEQSVLARQHMFLPETLIATRSFCLGLMRQGQLCSIAEFNAGDDCVILSNLAFSASRSDASLCSKFLETAKRRALEYFDRTELIVPERLKSYST